jgi:hypothetical protein
MRFRFFSPSACNQCANAKVTLLPVAGYNVRMTRRKSEITGHMNERDFPHLVELHLPPGGFLASARPNRAARDYSRLSCAVGTQLGPKTAPTRKVEKRAQAGGLQLTDLTSRLLALDIFRAPRAPGSFPVTEMLHLMTF